METLDPVRALPAYEIKAKVTSAGSEEEEETVGPLEDGEVWIFSDGSCLDGRVGATAVMYRREPKVLRYNMGLLTEHTIFEAEAIGVMLALHMLKMEWHVRKASIRLDNQAVLGALAERKPKLAQSIIDQILSQVETVWQRASDPTFQLEIGWVKGYSRIEGNEKVDAEAKEAAKG